MVYVILCSTVVYKFLFVSGQYFTIHIVHTLLRSYHLGYVHFSAAHATCLLRLYMVIRNQYCSDVYKQYTSCIIAFYTTLLQITRRSRFYENILLQRNYVRNTSTSHTHYLAAVIGLVLAQLYLYQCSNFSAFKQKEHSSKADKPTSVFTINLSTFPDLTKLQTPSNENFQTRRSSDTTSQRQFLIPPTDSSSLQSQRSSSEATSIYHFERTISHRPSQNGV